MTLPSPDTFIGALDFSKGLIPTVIQDEAGQVLTVAYSSEESLRQMILTGKGTYFSRSRQEIWMKGKTSGNTQEVIAIETDCDKDAVVVRVVQKGNACHTGTYSCFGEQLFTLQALQDVLGDRKKNPTNTSFTSSLFTHRKGATNKIAEKLGEEAFELVLAAKDDDKKRIIEEMGDLLYFSMVLLVEKDILFGEVVAALSKRQRGAV